MRPRLPFTPSRQSALAVVHPPASASVSIAGGDDGGGGAAAAAAAACLPVYSKCGAPTAARETFIDSFVSPPSPLAQPERALASCDFPPIHHTVPPPTSPLCTLLCAAARAAPLDFWTQRCRDVCLVRRESDPPGCCGSLPTTTGSKGE
ncbi:hypothetical protein CC78DRAFT_581052 [Lojkania enalia]|uniref:Uncharacterized protein n=1 Tax=Lojkania enalia TaxID=147567 RepID=A0A9P4K8V6_9PLEO|nr:hypothetical protein CC78DRAFT_581052 [Didymosphaeria enalia]